MHIPESKRRFLVELVRKVAAAEGSEDELNRWMARLDRELPHPAWTDLIYYPPGGVELSPDEVVERALAYAPTLL